jgi:uncharacterized protein YcfJ
MKSRLFLLTLLPALGFAQIQDQARVVSTTPFIKQVATPQQVCGTNQVAVQEPKSGEGALVGALAGGVIGNALGKGGNRGAATALGAVTGAVVGNQIEQPKVDVQNVTTCSTQNVIQNVTSYQVTYEYAGHQYSVEMATPPGPYVSVQVSIAVQGALQAQPLVAPPPQAPIAVQPGVVYVAPNYAAPGVGWAWEYDARFGWGWHHPRYGWHQGWR